MYRITLSLALILSLPIPVGAQTTQRQTVETPANDEGVDTLAAREAAQYATLGQFEVYTGFRFEDRVMTSGIDFVQESVQDSLKTWMPVHYDHGNGIAAADIDGDKKWDLYLATQLGSNGLYRNLGGGRFENITAEAGVGVADRVSVAPSFADVDNDGDPDLFVTTVKQGNLLFLNDGTGHFTDVTDQAGLGYVGHSSGSVFFDYNLDGQLDLFVSNVGIYTSDELGPGGFYRGLDQAFEGHLMPERSEPSILYQGLGDVRFEDVTAKVDLVTNSWTGDATFADLNGDLYPDLYLLDMQGDDLYYENQGGKSFVERTPEIFGKTSMGAMGVKFFDYNNDGRLDLIISDMHSDMHGQPVDPLKDEKKKYSFPAPRTENNILGNTFFRQKPDGTFEEVSDELGTENYWPWGVSVADLNADGFEDVFYSSSMNFPYRYGINSVLLNNRGEKFLDSEFILGVEPRRDGRTHMPLFDLDCQGADIENSVCKQLGEGAGAVTIVGSVGTRASIVFDIDGDGDLDIITNEFNDRPQVLVSNLSTTRQIHYLLLTLRGTQSNRDGLGAIVKVTAGDSSYLQSNDGKSGYLSQSSLPLYFGLDMATKVDKIEITWPSGVRQTIDHDIPLNTLFEVVEASDADQKPDSTS